MSQGSQADAQGVERGSKWVTEKNGDRAQSYLLVSDPCALAIRDEAPDDHSNLKDMRVIISTLSWMIKHHHLAPVIPKSHQYHRNSDVTVRATGPCRTSFDFNLQRTATAHLLSESDVTLACAFSLGHCWRAHSGVEFSAAAAAAKSLQSCPTLCDPTDGSSPGSPVPGILQARTLEWVAISFSVEFSAPAAAKSLQLCLTLCDPMDCSPPGSSIHGISQARVLE